MIVLQDRQPTLRQTALGTLGEALAAGVQGYSNAYQKGVETKREMALKKEANELNKKLIESQINRNNRYSPQGLAGAWTNPDGTPMTGQGGSLKDQLALQKFQRGQQEQNLALEVPGLGMARTKEEAKDIRSSQADANDAMAIIDQIKELGTNVSIFDRGKVGKINQLKTVLAGKLRLPLTGPGAMTEDEFQRLISNIGDPSAVFGTEANEKAKLDQLKEILTNSVQSKFASASRSTYSPQGFSSGKQQVALAPLDYRGQSPSVEFSPINAPNISPIQNAHASDFKSIDSSSLASRREQLLRKRGGQ